MSRNGSGTYSLPAGQPVVSGTSISSSVFNTLTSDLATALTGSVAANGETPITGSLRAVTGSVGVPIYSWTASTSTGLYSPATNQAAMAANGVQSMLWTSTGVSVPGTFEVTGHTTFEGVTSTGATGTGKLVYDTSPTLTTPVLGTPTSGTLTNCTGLPPAGVAGTAATLAGAEQLTNKTLNASVAKGTWTASGTWTLPAHTLGGNVSSTGNPSLNIGTGALTAGSLTLSGAGLFKDNGSLMAQFNNASNTQIGTIKDYAGAFIFRGESVTTSIATSGAYDITINPNNSVVGRFSPTGLAVTGTIQGSTTIGVGAATPAASGAGITFPATQSASSDANTLCDFERGTWTPVIGGSGGVSGQSYSSQSGLYCKIDRCVTCTFDMTLSNKGTISGGLQINPYPFTCASTSSGGVAFGYFSGLTTSVVNLFSNMAVSGTYSGLWMLTAAGTAVSSMATGDISNTTRLLGTATYNATA